MELAETVGRAVVTLRQSPPDLDLETISRPLPSPRRCVAWTLGLGTMMVGALDLSSELGWNFFSLKSKSSSFPKP